MREIKYHPKALVEASASARYYERQQPGLGWEFYQALDQAVEQMLHDPMRAKTDAEGVRSWRLKRFPFRVFYLVDPTRIRIIAIAHLQRFPRFWGHRVND